MKTSVAFTILLTAIAVISCKKKKQEYKVTYAITGECAYTYSQGSNKGSGNCVKAYSFNRVAESGDYLDLDAAVYSTAGFSDTVSVEIIVSPPVDGSNTVITGFKTAHANVYLK